MSDFGLCSNLLQLDLISLLVNLSCELGPIMVRYDLLEVRLVTLSNVLTDSNLIKFHFLSNCSNRSIMIRYDFLVEMISYK